MTEKNTEYEFSKAFQEDDDELFDLHINGDTVKVDKHFRAGLNTLGPAFVKNDGTMTFEEFFAGFEERYTENELFLMKWCWWLGTKKGFYDGL